MTDDKSNGAHTKPEHATGLPWANLEPGKYRSLYERDERYIGDRAGTEQRGSPQEAVRLEAMNPESLSSGLQARASAFHGNDIRDGESEIPLEEPAWVHGSRAGLTNVSGSGNASMPVNGSVAMSGSAASTEPLQQSRERVASRWFALKGVLNAGGDEAASTPVPEREAHVPYLGVFSLAGGVGKTSIVATLGRALSGYGERVLLVDAASYSPLPFYFGARELHPGQVRTFSPPGGSTDVPIHLVEHQGSTGEGPAEDSLVADLRRFGRGSNRVLVDLATASGPLLRSFLHLAPTLVVPITPDMNSVVSLSVLDAFFRRYADGDAPPVQPFFLLSHFDASLPLHLDVREVLREELGDRLLPFVLRRSAAVSEALAEGMTVVDYAPNSPVAEDFLALANWVRSTTAPAATGFRGVRWSER
ncbi:MAG TPA: cellulose synthase operon protein YhjQ/BcsQ [Acidisarcina sp.]|nr:cellulose synthase operon protein YhjQ/BcsQ [Acidisarcina sp.]